MAKEGHPRGKTEGTEKESNQVKAPSLSLPKGGGAIYSLRFIQATLASSRTCITCSSTIYTTSPNTTTTISIL